ncbi:perilipin-2-like [Poecilia latipinna]|uniref:perilipin-2-like n=1 Tax=Poecilia formosa TaxID=48698 RepID=UPI0004446656|nr:PREDICTED: perilipin-2-like [Poecilia formosa]XP_014889334.1 PREDICTED: perilipin-2-like [Poecilia latipinna]
MPVNNNNQKVVPNAAARLIKLPVVRSACATLSVLYSDAKSSNPGLRSLCEALESGVTALSTAACTRASPVIVKLEPQISIANNFACKGLDWLETSFPVLLSPPDEVVAAAKSKVNRIRAVVGIAAGGTVVTVQHTVTWVISRLNQVDNIENQSMVERAISMASMGLDSALTVSEALVDQVLPLPEEGRIEEETHLVEGFEASVRSGSYSVRMMKLTAKVCWRTYHMVGSKIHFVQITEFISRPTTLVQDLQTSCRTLVWNLQGLPQHFQHQAVSVFLFFSQMRNLSSPSSHQEQTRHGSHFRAAEGSPPSKELACSQSTPALRMRPTKTSVFENGCVVKGCVRR